jgi:hypothetical protein
MMIVGNVNSRPGLEKITRVILVETVQEALGPLSKKAQ